MSAVRTPSLIPSVNPISLPIGPEEAFVLSQVNGYTSSSDIALVTGFPEDKVDEILLRLRQLGAVDWSAATASGMENTSPTAETRAQRASKSRPQAVSKSSLEAKDVRDVPKAISAPPPLEEAPPAQPEKESSSKPEHAFPRRHGDFDPTLLEEPGEIDRATKTEILRFWARIEHDTHYELLGIDSAADKKAVKAAFFELVNVFHTDRFFGKDLGTFRARLEKIFAALTRAHDTLTRDKKRSDYDQYLASVNLTRGVRDSHTPGRLSANAPSTPAIPAAPRAPKISVSSGTESELDGSGGAQETDRQSLRAPAPTSQAATGTAANSSRIPDSDALKRLLAKKFGHREGPPSRPGGVAPSDPVATSSADPDLVKKHIGEQMRARFEARNAGAASPRSQVEHYLELAQGARERNEWGSAMNALRVGLSLEPEDAELKARLEAYQQEANRALADQFADQGRYEESDALYARAARSYEKAAIGKQLSCQGHRAASLFERASHCLMEADGDERKAVELARQAVVLDPKAGHRLTLARAYERAKMKTSALGEVERALATEPNHEEAKAAQKRLK